KESAESDCAVRSLFFCSRSRCSSRRASSPDTAAEGAPSRLGAMTKVPAATPRAMPKPRPVITSALLEVLENAMSYSHPWTVSAMLFQVSMRLSVNVPSPPRPTMSTTAASATKIPKTAHNQVKELPDFTVYKLMIAEEATKRLDRKSVV